MNRTGDWPSQENRHLASGERRRHPGCAELTKRSRLNRESRELHLFCDLAGRNGSDQPVVLKEKRKQAHQQGLRNRKEGSSSHKKRWPSSSGACVPFKGILGSLMKLPTLHNRVKHKYTKIRDHRSLMSSENRGSLSCTVNLILHEGSSPGATWAISHHLRSICCNFQALCKPNTCPEF